MESNKSPIKVTILLLFGANLAVIRSKETWAPIGIAVAIPMIEIHI